jgi:hypothetical protein
MMGTGRGGIVTFDDLHNAMPRTLVISERLKWSQHAGPIADLNGFPPAWRKIDFRSPS